MSQAISTYRVAMDGDIIAQFELDGRLLGRVRGPREVLMQLFANAPKQMELQFSGTVHEFKYEPRPWPEPEDIG